MLMLFLVLLLGQEADVKPIAEATRRSVWVETDKQIGSGVIVQTGIVLTNFHVLEVDSTIKVDDEEAEIVAVAPQYDLILLRVKTKKMSPVRLCLDTEVGSEVFYVANTNKHRDYTSFGRITFVDRNYLYSNTTAIEGSSGGGLYNPEGCLVGINDASEYHAIAVHIKAKTVQKFLEQNKGVLK